MSVARLTAAVLLVLGGALPAVAQTVPPRGTDATVDVAAWNVERFGSPAGGPSNDTQQRLNVGAVVRQAAIDVWAFEEINNPTEWQRLLNDLAPDGYVGVLGPSVSTNPDFDLRLGFIYNPAVVSLILTRSILTANASSFGGRAPFEMITNVTAGGVTRQLRLIAIHAKAGGTQADYQDRLAGATALKTYTDAYVAQGLSFIVLGDYNDELGLSIASGQLSPYRTFVNDDTRYTFATRPLDQANIPTFCGSSPQCTSGSTLDHLLIPSTLIDTYVAGSGDRYGELIGSIPSYVFSTSDHLPVLARFDLTMPNATPGPVVAGPATLLPAAPMPFRDATTLRVRLDRPAQVRLDVVDVLGRVVAVLADGPLTSGEHPARLSGAALAPGLYLVRLTADGQTATQTLVRTR